MTGIDRWGLYSQLPSKLKICFKNKLLFEWLIQNQMDDCKILYVIIFTIGTQTTHICFLTETGKVLVHLFFLLFGWFKIWKRNQKINILVQSDEKWLNLLARLYDIMESYMHLDCIIHIQNNF